MILNNDSDDDGDVSVGQSPSEVRPLSLLKFRQKAAYSVGHVLNDLCASMWFTYLLLYFNYVKEFGPTLAGELLLVGQVADGLATPFVGLESDKEKTLWLCGKYGKRKAWHLVGTAAVLISFPFIFAECSWCKGADNWAQFFYYSIFIVIFQFGWASTQISHLSLIPDLTSFPSERVTLNAFRYAFTVASNILVYLVTWIVLNVQGSDSSSQVGPADAQSFQLIVFIVVGVGAVFSLIFHLFVPDPTRDGFDDDAVSDASGFTVDRSLHLSWKEWFMESQFYVTGLLYMATRLYVNMSQVFIGLYLQKTLQLPKSSIAIIPLVMYVSGFAASFPINFMAKKLKLRTIYTIGAVCAVAAALWINFGDETSTFNTYEIYAVSALIGIASTILLITSLAITNELIGASTASGAFVFGAMSFLDKLSNGVIVIVIESLHECTNCLTIPRRYYYHYVMVYACGGAAVFGFVALLVLANTQQSDRRKDLMNRTPLNRSYANLNECSVVVLPSERTPLVGPN